MIVGFHNLRFSVMTDLESQKRFEMSGIELVNPGLLELHHICLDREKGGTDRHTERLIHVETKTD